VTGLARRRDKQVNDDRNAGRQKDTNPAAL
jgi:hypothetical protein